MTITIKTASGVILAEVDSNTIFSGRIKATYHACPLCGRAPVMGRDDGRWFLVGNSGCSTCHGLWPMPSEQEMVDMLKKVEQT